MVLDDQLCVLSANSLCAAQSIALVGVVFLVVSSFFVLSVFRYFGISFSGASGIALAMPRGSSPG